MISKIEPHFCPLQNKTPIKSNSRVHEYAHVIDIHKGSQFTSSNAKMTYYSAQNMHTRKAYI